MSRKWRNWYQNVVDEEIKGADSIGSVKQKDNQADAKLVSLSEKMQEED